MAAPAHLLKPQRRETKKDYEYRAAATAGLLSFRLSWEYRSKGKLYEATEAHLAPGSAYAVEETALPAGKSDLMMIFLISQAEFLNFCND